MIKHYLLFAVLLFSMQLIAQTGIGTASPHPSAKLEVTSTDKGFLPPRVTLTSGTDNTTIANPATGLLVYNTGNNSGLVAGYYYWNGSSWATIATASGSGVSASILRGSRSSAQTGLTNGGNVIFTQVDNIAGQEMSLNTTTGQITLAAGRTYRLMAQVPNYQTSAAETRTQFAWYNETAGAYIGSSSNAYTPSSGASYGATGGLSEAVITTTTSTVVSYRIAQLSNTTQLGGNADFTNTGSYPWFEAQVISGNAPVNGQSVDYVSVSLTGSNQTVNSGSVVLFNTNNGGNIPYNASTGMFSLTSGKTYRLTGVIALASSNSSQAEVNVGWRTAAGDIIGGRGEALSSNFATTAFGAGIADIIYTPQVNTTISLYVTYSNTDKILWQNFTYANIQQIGSSAIINPWTLSGTETYNTTGNVGIGTNTPTSRLNIAGGGVKLTTGFGNSTNRPSLNTSSIGNYEIRGVGSISGSAQNDLADDGFLRLSAGGGTSVNSQSSIDISGFSTVADMSNNIVMRTNGTERLRIDNSGNVNVTGKLNVTDPSGSVSTKLTARFTAGTFISFDNLRFSVTTGDPRGLSIATVSGSVNLYVEGRYNNGGVYGTRTASSVTYTTSPSGSPFGWGFNSSGDTIIYHLTDADNGRLYRVTLIIMPSYINNFICIERLL